MAAHAEIFLISSFCAKLASVSRLHLLVLRLRDQGGVDGEDVGEHLAEAVDALGDGGGVVGDVAQVALQLLVDAVLVEPGRSAPSSMPSSGRVARWNSITSRDSS